MTDRRIVYTRPDGGLSIVVPSPKFIVGFDTDDDALAVVGTLNVPVDAADVVECTVADLPADRSFRDAWVRHTGPGPAATVDMAKARLIHMGRIRDARDAALKDKDVEWMRAMGAKDQTLADQVEAERQMLRDLPQTFNLSVALTPDELKALWPAQLSGTAAR